MSWNGGWDRVVAEMEAVLWAEVEFRMGAGTYTAMETNMETGVEARMDP